MEYNMMNSQLPVLAIGRQENGITIEYCYGEIPDVFQELWFDPIKELELQDAKETNEDFQDWLSIYRHATPNMGRILLEGSK
jgi:hypothetical protein